MENHDLNHFLTKTNKQFYTKRKKTFQIQVNATVKAEKTLQLLLNKRLGTTSKKKHLCLTEQSQETKKTTDLQFEENQIKIKLESLLKRLNMKWNGLYKMFQKLMCSRSKETFERRKVDYYETFYLMCLNEDKKKRGQNDKKEKIQNYTELRQKQIYLENLKLQKENNLLRSQIFEKMTPSQKKKEQNFLKFLFEDDQHEKQKQNVSQTKEFEQEKSIKRLQRSLEMKNQECEILRKEVQIKKEDLFLIQEEKKQLHERLVELKTNNENLCSEIVAYQMFQGTSNSTPHNETLKMQRQEVLSYEYQLSEFRKSYMILARKYKSMVVKMKKIAIESGSNMQNFSKKYQQIFHEQMQAFQKMKNKDEEMMKKKLQNNDVKKKGEKGFSYQSYLGQKQTINNKQGVKKNFTNIPLYFKPNFYCLISEELKYFGIDENNYEHINLSIKLDFLATIRAIMDSKYNQFVFYKNNRDYTSFPVFVFSWLSSFRINAKKRKEVFPLNQQPPRDCIPNFYANLMSEKLNPFWEVVTFRQFLLQSLTIDDLYYYLGLRMYLMKGDMLKSLDSFFEELYYIEYDKAQEIVDKFVKDNEYKKNIGQFMRRSATYVRKKSYIDSHYVLRLMLEYYQYMKKRQIEMIVKTIEIVTQHKIMNIQFMDFLKIFDYHFTQLSFTERIQLYSECYNIGNGTINIETVLAVFHEKKLFIGFVEKMLLNQSIKIQHSKTEFSELLISPPYRQLYEAEKKFQQLSVTNIQSEMNDLGVESVLSRFRKSMRLNSFSIHERLEEYFQICMYESKKLFRTGNINILELGQTILTLTEFLSKWTKSTIEKRQIKKLLILMRYKQASEKIIHFYRKKKLQMDRNYVYSFAKMMMKNEEDDKIENLRIEFENIIQSMRGKKLTTLKNIE